MKAISIPQPVAGNLLRRSWAVIGRSRETDYRGPVAIHAAARNPALVEAEQAGMPRSVILGIGQLVACVSMADVLHYERTHRDFLIPPLIAGTQVDVRQVAGLYGRSINEPWGWIIEDLVTLLRPIRCVGAGGLWEVPVEISEALMACRQ